MASEYDPKAIELKWQKEWARSGIYNVREDSDKPKHYFLVEFPYPSGNLHVGHWYAFAVPDIAVRFHRMNGRNVLFPIGFDAFGLPAENAAIKRKLNPRDWTFDNIDHMKRQLSSMGASFDWSREVITCDPAYYKWTQWMFTKFFEKGLAYQAEREVNWCPSCKTVLANEQVVNGKCERCDTEVVLKNLLQWNLKITDYADRLLNDLDKLDWPKPIKEAQKNWIGKSEGALIKFNDVEVFTTRPDTIYGATFIAVAGKEDKFTGKYVTNPVTQEKIPVWEAEYVLSDYGTGAIMGVPAHDERDFEFAKKHDLPIKHVVIPHLTDPKNPHQEGREIVFRNAVIVILKNPKNGKILTLKWKKLPWTTFVMGGIEEGESAEEAAAREIKEETGYKNLKFIKSLGGPIHNEFYAAHKGVNRIAHTQGMVYELIDEEKEDVSEEEKNSYEIEWVAENEIDLGNITHTEAGMLLDRMSKEAGAYSGEGVLINSEDFDMMPSAEARKKIVEKFGQSAAKYKLRDWVVSRQRYWGVPIPVIHCEKCGVAAVLEEDLPVRLPEIDDYLPRDDGKSPLAKAAAWVEVKCPKCGGKAERETDTLDTFVDSSWYYLAYLCKENSKFEFRNLKLKFQYWMPVDFYSGGAEHTTMHLLYSRFWHKALFDLGLVGESEPYLKRMNRGLIMGPDGQKMSKSRGNVIDPDKEVERLGSDTVRIYLAFIGPFNEVGSYPWNPDAAVGVRRFLEKVWRIRFKIQDLEFKNDSLLHSTIKKVSEEIGSMKMNTAVSALMVFANDMDRREKVSEEEYKTFLKLLAPFAPHITEELWHSCGFGNGVSKSIHLEGWPAYDETKLVADTATIVIQVNGKVRAKFEVNSEMGEKEVLDKAMSLPEVQKWVGDKTVEKSIFVPRKLVNIVTS